MMRPTQALLVLVVIYAICCMRAQASDGTCCEVTRKEASKHRTKEGYTKGRSPRPNYLKLPLQEGACQQYGHSCLGGHGKRSGASSESQPDIQNDLMADSNGAAEAQDRDWLLPAGYFQAEGQGQQRPLVAPLRASRVLGRLLRAMAASSDQQDK